MFFASPYYLIDFPKSSLILYICLLLNLSSVIVPLHLYRHNSSILQIYTISPLPIAPLNQFTTPTFIPWYLLTCLASTPHWSPVKTHLHHTFTIHSSHTISAAAVILTRWTTHPGHTLTVSFIHAVSPMTRPCDGPHAPHPHPCQVPPHPATPTPRRSSSMSST